MKFKITPRNIIITISILSLSLLLMPSGTLNANATGLGFSGDFAPSNWELTNTANTDGTINITSAPDSITIIGGDSGSGTPGNTEYTVTSTYSCTITFDWAYSTADGHSEWDTALYVINHSTNGFGLSSPTGNNDPQYGSTSVQLSAGDTLGFRIHTFDNLGGAATLVISNFDSTGCSSTSARLVFTSGAPQTLGQEATSSAITVQRQDQNGDPISSGTTTVHLSSTSVSGKFDTIPDGPFDGTITSVTISSGSTATFYYKDTTAGSPTIASSSIQLASATSVFTITAAPGPSVNSQSTITRDIRHDDTRIPPPSLSGTSNMKISDGFTISDDSYEVSSNYIDLPNHNLILKTPQTIVIKTYSDSALGLAVEHMSVNFGIHPMSNNGQSTFSIIWDKKLGCQVNDPQGFVSNVSVDKTDGIIEKFTFTFTPEKHMPLSDILVKTWNNKLSSIDYIMTDAVKFSGEFLTPSQSQLPAELRVYDNISDLNNRLETDGYVKPNVLSHIHNTFSVFSGGSGNVYWFYDIKDKTVALVIEDGSGKVLDIQLETLAEQSVQQTSIYSNHILSRSNVDELESAKSAETLKALNMLIQLYGKNYIIQYHLVGQ